MVDFQFNGNFLNMLFFRLLHLSIFNAFMRACAMNELLQCGGLTSGNMRGL